MAIDLYLKHIYIHQFSPADTEVQFVDQEVTITPQLDEYFRKKLSKVFSDDAKRGKLDSEHQFMDFVARDLLDASHQIATIWKEEFVISEDQKKNDLVFIEFDRDGQAYLAFLRITLKESLTHLFGETEDPIKMTNNTMPSAAQAPDEALIIRKTDGQYYLIEKRVRHNGSFANYFSEKVLQDQPDLSVKKSIKVIEDTAHKVADSFNRDDFDFQKKVKTAIHHDLEEEVLSAESLANQLFEDNLTARLTFIDELKETIPTEIPVQDIDHSRQVKKFETQKLSLSNGIELIVPNQVYDDAESVEFIQNNDGTYSILIKNIQDIQNK